MPEDLFEFATFSDSMKAPLIDAFRSVTNLANSSYDQIAGGDMTIGPVNFDQARSKQASCGNAFDLEEVVFAPAFDAIHDGMMQREKAPDYLFGILQTAMLVVLNREHNETNRSLLWRESHITKEFMATLWNRHEVERSLRQDFDLYHFSGISSEWPVTLRCSYDQENNRWSIGYSIRKHLAVLHYQDS